MTTVAVGPVVVAIPVVGGGSLWRVLHVGARAVGLSVAAFMVLAGVGCVVTRGHRWGRWFTSSGLRRISAACAVGASVVVGCAGVQVVAERRVWSHAVTLCPPPPTPQPHGVNFVVRSAVSRHAYSMPRSVITTGWAGAVTHGCVTRVVRSWSPQVPPVSAFGFPVSFLHLVRSS
jgi:hypothetical protein